MMPEMDGIEALTRIRALGGRFAEQRIIALSANATKDAQALFMASGFDHFLAKPIDSAALREVVKRYVPADKLSVRRDDGGASEDEIIRRAAVIFVNDNRDTFVRFLTALNAGDAKTAHRIAHTLKSGAAYLGKTALSEAARAAEAALSVSPHECADALVTAMGDELAAVLAELAPLMPETTPTETVQADAARINEILDDLEGLLTRGDFAASEYAEELMGYEGYGALAGCLDDYDFDGALAALRRMKR
jgi:HPt (histidine-containing phosphotransfer) domain-containing protein